tara:strand:+ start:285 stop:443 length:159 start_codon:yes stop_codon:yes gene_type:complete
MFFIDETLHAFLDRLQLQTTDDIDDGRAILRQPGQPRGEMTRAIFFASLQTI